MLLRTKPFLQPSFPTPFFYQKIIAKECEEGQNNNHNLCFSRMPQDEWRPGVALKSCSSVGEIHTSEDICLSGGQGGANRLSPSPVSALPRSRKRVSTSHLEIVLMPRVLIYIIWEAQRLRESTLPFLLPHASTPVRILINLFIFCPASLLLIYFRRFNVGFCFGWGMRQDGENE